MAGVWGSLNSDVFLDRIYWGRVMPCESLLLIKLRPLILYKTQPDGLSGKTFSNPPWSLKNEKGRNLPSFTVVLMVIAGTLLLQEDRSMFKLSLLIKKIKTQQDAYTNILWKFSMFRPLTHRSIFYLNYLSYME